MFQLSPRVNKDVAEILFCIKNLKLCSCLFDISAEMCIINRYVKKIPESKIRQFICKSAIKQNHYQCIKHPIIDIFCSEIVKMLDNFPFISSNICLPAFYFQVPVTLSHLQNRLISLSQLLQHLIIESGNSLIENIAIAKLAIQQDIN